jgi:uncharacterized lipoprotein YddW (UPF0748 family)
MSTTLPAYDFCYCAHCKAQFGKEPIADDEAWREFRLNAVAATANALIETVRAAGKRCGAAVFPTPKMASQMVYQDWSRFNLDFAFPMVYHSFYGEKIVWNNHCTLESRRAIDGRFPIYPGLHLPDFTRGELDAHLQFLLHLNPDGVCLFSHETFTPERQAALKKEYNCLPWADHL